MTDGTSGVRDGLSGEGAVRRGRGTKAERKATWLFAAKKDLSQEAMGILTCSQCCSFWARVGAEPAAAKDGLCWQLSTRKVWGCVQKVMVCVAPLSLASLLFTTRGFLSCWLLCLTALLIWSPGVFCHQILKSCFPP